MMVEKIYSLFLLAGFGLALAMLAFSASPGFAAEGFAKTTVGNMEVITLVDTESEFDPAIFQGADPQLIKQLAGDKKLPSSINAFVVKKGETVILVDTGMGNKIYEHLQAAGLKQDDIDAVLLTHCHGDHIKGLFENGKKAFPNADVWIAPKELEFWQKQNANQVEQCRSEYGDFHEITPDEKTSVLIPEITAIDIAGHTPGHTAFLIQSEGQSFLLAADLLHSVTLQFSHPEICARFDGDQDAAVKIRREILSRAAENLWGFAGAHIPWPGFGHVEKEGKAFRFIPKEMK